jgi:D-alanyl-lipoteichoic acid acyltransferase DltB (MBOAT superfamily)
MLAVERALGIGRGERAQPAGVSAWLRATLTFVLVMLAWVLFRARSFHDALAVYGSMFALRAGSTLVADLPLVITACIVATGVVLFARKQQHAVLLWERLAWPAQSAAIAGLLFFFQFFWYQPSATQFVYFKF